VTHRRWAALRPWYWTLIIPISIFVIVGAGWYVGNNVLADGKSAASDSLQVVGHNVTQKVTVPATTKTVAGTLGASVLSVRTVGDTILRTVRLPGGGTTVVSGPTQTVTTTTPGSTVHDPGTTVHDPGPTTTVHDPGPTTTVQGPPVTVPVTVTEPGPTTTVVTTVFSTVTVSAPPPST
jgi:hypothetical protein